MRLSKFIVLLLVSCVASGCALKRIQPVNKMGNHSLLTSENIVLSDACVVQNGVLSEYTLIDETAELADQRAQSLVKHLSAYNVPAEALPLPAVCHTPTYQYSKFRQNWDGEKFNLGKTNYPFSRNSQPVDAERAEAHRWLRCSYLSYLDIDSQLTRLRLRSTDNPLYTGMRACLENPGDQMSAEYFRGAYPDKDHIFVMTSWLKTRTKGDKVFSFLFGSAGGISRGMNLGVYDIKRGEFVWATPDDDTPRPSCEAPRPELKQSQFERYLSPLLCKSSL